MNSVLPDYAVSNLKHLKSTFPGKRICLVSDNETNLNIAKELGVESFKVDGIQTLWPRVSELMSLPKNFRKGFWITSLIRFKAIEKYLMQNPESQIIQIEADVLLMTNFPFEKIGSLENRICYPLVSGELAAASIFVANDLDSMMDFNSEIENFFKSSSDHSDMTILAKISLLRPDLISILPTVPNFVQAPTASLEDDYSRMSANFSFFDGVFDAATWGMYFIGTDARNQRGIRRIGIDFALHSLKASGFRLKTKQEGGMCISAKNLNEFNIFNLHIHSKGTKIFDPIKQAKVISAYEGLRYLGITRLFSAKIFFSAAIAKLYRSVGILLDE